MPLEPQQSAIISADSRPSFVSAPENPDPVAAPSVSGGAPNVPAQAPPVGTQSQITPAVPPSPNKGLHSFINSFLSSTVGALAGKAPVKYETDAEGRTVPAKIQPTDSLGDKGRRLAAHALEGLAAGSQVQPQKSGLASALAGMGAGAGAVTADQRAQDAKARQQERENEEAKQQKLLRMHEIMKLNATTGSIFQHMMDEEQDRDPARQQHVSWAKAAEDAGVPVRYVSEEEARQLQQTDKYAVAKFGVLPVGMKMVTDDSGNPVLDESGKPKMQGQFALIDGFHDGNIPTPQSFLSDLQKYGKFGGLSSDEVSGLKVGDDLSMPHFIQLAQKVQEGKKNELAGWATAELGWQGENPVQINKNTREVRPFPTGVTPNVENKPEDTTAQKKLRESQAREADAKAKEALANAAAASQGLGGSGAVSKDAIDNVIKSYGNLPKSAQAVLRSLAPNQQADVLQLWAGRKDPKDFTTNPRKGGGEISRAQATRLVQVFDPTWRENKYETVKKLDDDFTSGKTGTSIQGFGQLMQHMAEAVQDSNNFQRTNSPVLDIPLNKLRSQVGGNSEIKALDADIIAARNEWMNVIKNGHAADKNETDAAAVLLSDSSSPRQILTAINAMGKQSVARLGEINNRYKTVTGANYPNLISPEAKAAAESLGLGKDIARFSSGGTMFSGASPIANSGAPQNPQSGQPQSGIQVTDPQGGVHTFSDQVSADNFKKLAGIK